MISAGQVNSTQKYKTLTDQDRRQIEAGICDTDTKCTSAMNVPVDAELAKGDGHGNAITDAISERFHEGLRSITGGLAQSCSQQTEKAGAKRKQKYFECTTSIILKNGEVQLLGEKGSFSAQVEKAGAIARGEIAPPSPDYLELPKSIKDFIAKLPTELPDDLDGQAEFAKAAERIYRQAMAILYPRAEMINAMDPAGQQVLDDAALGLEKQLSDYKAGDQGKLDEIKHTIPYALSGEAPYELKLTLRPAEFGDEDELIPAEMVRLFKEAMNYFEPKGGTDVKSLITKLKEAVKDLKDPAAELPGLEVKDVGVSGGGASKVEIGPKSKVGMEVPTVLINKVNAQNDPAKQWALDYLFMQALKKVEKKLKQKNKKVTPEVRMAIVEQLAQETQFMDAFTVSVQQVGAPRAVPMLSPVPDALWKPIVNAIESVRRSSPAIDSYAISYFIKANDLYQQAKVAKGRPSGMTDETLAGKLGEEVAAIIADGKGVPYEGEDKNVKIVTNVKYLLNSKFMGFNKDGSINIGVPSSGGGEIFKLHDSDDDDEGLHFEGSLGLGSMSSPVIDKEAKAEGDNSPDNFLGNVSLYFNYLARTDDKKWALDLRAGADISYMPNWYDAKDGAVDITGGDHGGGWGIEASTLSAAVQLRPDESRAHVLELELGLFDPRSTNAAKAGFGGHNRINGSLNNSLSSETAGGRFSWSYEGDESKRSDWNYGPASKYSTEDAPGGSSPVTAGLNLVLGADQVAFGNEMVKPGGGLLGAAGYVNARFPVKTFDWTGALSASVQKSWGEDENGDSLAGLSYHIGLSTVVRPFKHLEVGGGFGVGQTETAKMDEPQLRLNAGGYAAVPLYFHVGDRDTKLVLGASYGYGLVKGTVYPAGDPEDVAEGCVVNGQPDEDCDNVPDTTDECPSEPGKTEVLEGDQTGLGCCEPGQTCSPTNTQYATVESGSIDDRTLPNWDFGGATHAGTLFIDWYLSKAVSIYLDASVEKFKPIMAPNSDTLGYQIMGGIRVKLPK